MSSGASSSRKQNFVECLPGFQHVNRYYDNQLEKVVAKILPGEYYVTMEDECITTVLGSCVSACIRDRQFGIGGMNHFMLPYANDMSNDFTTGIDLSASARYGTYAMEHMINDILKFGGRRKNLEAKIVGGGRILQNMTNIGASNVAFVRQYLQAEGITIIGEDCGDVFPRKVIYGPKTGAAKVKKLQSLHNDTVLVRESRYIDQLRSEPVAGEVELF